MKGYKQRYKHGYKGIKTKKSLVPHQYFLKNRLNYKWGRVRW